MKKILLSLGMIVFVGAVAVGATGAFFSDTETSTGNTFTAGAIDLKVDSQSHYNGLICREKTTGVLHWLEPVGTTEQALLDLQAQNLYDTACDGTWSQTDLGLTHKFFNLTDIKPGDSGEDTISLHVLGNDAWGRFVISAVQDVDNSCTEPEAEASTTSAELCTILAPELLIPGSGELASSTTFFAWLDQGAIPGFQNIDTNGHPVDVSQDGGIQLPDPTEGDNIQQCVTPGSAATCAEPTVIAPGPVDDVSNVDNSTEIDEIHNIWLALAAVRAATPACVSAPVNGHVPPAVPGLPYGTCNGLAVDGRMVGSTTYYFGLGWTVLPTVGNEAQTDSLNANLVFQAVQQRNNSSHSF